MKISFIVPTKNSARTMHACLGSLRAQTHPDVEIIVVDNASTDGTDLIAAQYADIVENRGPERSAQRNRGAALATGEVIMFIDSDMTLEATIAADIVRTFESKPEVGALIVPERSFGEGFFAACRVLEKSLYVGDDSVEAARAYRREAFAATGGWNEDLTAAEDWDLADRTREAGIKIARIDSWIWHDEGRIVLKQTFKKKRYYGRWMSDYLHKEEGQGGRRIMRTSLFSQPKRLAADPVHAAGMVLLKGVEASGVALGMWDTRKARKDAA